MRAEILTMGTQPKHSEVCRTPGSPITYPRPKRYEWSPQHWVLHLKGFDMRFTVKYEPDEEDLRKNTVSWRKEWFSIYGTYEQFDGPPIARKGTVIKYCLSDANSVQTFWSRESYMSDKQGNSGLNMTTWSKQWTLEYPNEPLNLTLIEKPYQWTPVREYIWPQT